MRWTQVITPVMNATIIPPAGLVFNVTKGKLTPFTFGTWLLSLNPARSQPSLPHRVCVLGVQVLV